MKETVEKIAHIKSWEDIKKIFKNKVEEIPGIGKQAKSGSFGKLWKLKGKNLTLKLTTDIFEMETARDLLGKDSKAFLKIHKIIETPTQQVGGKNLPPLQLRVQELCYPIDELKKTHPLSLEKSTLTDQIRGNFSEIRGNIKTATDADVFFDALKDIEDEEESYTAAKLQEIGNDPVKRRELAQFVVKLVNLLERVEADISGVDVADDLDIHTGNIMQDKKGTWKLVDF